MVLYTVGIGLEAGHHRERQAVCSAGQAEEHSRACNTWLVGVLVGVLFMASLANQGPGWYGHWHLGSAHIIQAGPCRQTQAAGCSSEL